MELATSRPRFRTDLVAECIEAEGQRFIDVIDPDTGDAFRFYEVEYSLACAMDGERDLAGLAQWAREELGIEPTPAELSTVISTLGHLGYLEHAPAAQAAAEVAARGRGDDEFGLAPGVVAATPDRGLPVRGDDLELGKPGVAAARGFEPELPRSDVELGLSGGRAPARLEPLSDGDDVELGTPGVAAEPVATLKRSKTRPDQDDDGPTHLPPAAVPDFDDEVSVDLSEHLSLRPDDVKEAVRMSRTMKAVDVPKELLEELGEKEAQQAARVEADRPGVSGSGTLSMDAGEPTPPPAELPVLPPRLEVKPIEKRADPVAEKKPVELPGKPVVVSKKPEVRPEPKAAAENPIAGNQPSGGTSTVLIVLLVLVILGAGAFFVWKYVINKPSADEAATQSKPTPDKGTRKTPDPKTDPKTDPGTGKVATGSGDKVEPDKVPVAPPPTATLTASAPATTEVTGGAGGVVFFAVADGATVAVDDVVVKYKGVQLLEKKLGSETSGLLWDVTKRYPREIEKATSLRDLAAKSGKTAVVKAQDAKIKERSARLEEKKKEAAELQAKIDAMAVKAPVAGQVVSAVKVGTKVAADGVVASIAGGEGSLVASFEVAAGKTYAVDADVQLANRDQAEQKATCVVSAVEGTKVTVTCAADSGFTAGATVVLE